jgi:DNA-binding NtrC family response regulator
MGQKQILVVDDNDLFRDSIVEVLRRQGYGVQSAGSGDEAVKIVTGNRFDCIISDLKMPSMSGIELLEKIREIDQDVPFLIVTAYGQIETAVEAIKKGAYDYLEKTEKLSQQLELTVERTLAYRSLLDENRQLRTELSGKWDFIGSTHTMDEIRELVTTIAPSKSTVLVTGESGTGKELVARSIHYMSPRHSAPFIKINCASLPEGLIESELFGHEKGAFTGAIKDKKGKFEYASGGTLLLDEIGEMPFSVQAKLLRVLQEGELTKVGGNEPVPVDVRIVATTNRDLEEEIRQGRFREDLFYRLNVFHIHLPALRERRDDIGMLVDHFIRKYNDENGFSVDGVDPGCLEVLNRYDWPGNIRELENAVERAVVLTKSGTVGAEQFNPGSMFVVNSVKNNFNFQPGVTISEAEKELILQTLAYCNQNRTRAAEVLGISIRTLRNKLHEYNDDTGDGREEG